MSTTVVHPRTTRFPGRNVGMIIVGVALAAAIGYGISVTGDEPAQTNVAGSQSAGADQLILNRAAELAAERQNLLNQATKGIGPAVVTAPQASTQSLADQLATSQIGADAWAAYLSGQVYSSGTTGNMRQAWINHFAQKEAEGTPTFDGQTGPR